MLKKRKKKLQDKTPHSVLHMGFRKPRVKIPILGKSIEAQEVFNALLVRFLIFMPYFINTLFFIDQIYEKVHFKL